MTLTAARHSANPAGGIRTALGGKRIDVLFAIEREINGLAPQERLRVRQERSRPLITELQGRRITPLGASTNSCLGTGVLKTSLTLLESNHLSAQDDLTRALGGGVRRFWSDRRRASVPEPFMTTLQTQLGLAASAAIA